MPQTGATAVDPRRLRRTALHRQGLLSAAPFGRGAAGTRRAIEHLGYVQIDTISVVSRAHDHVLQTRVPGYRPAMLGRLQRQRAIFEYWAHAAAYLPMGDYRYAQPFMGVMRSRRKRWAGRREEALMRRVLDRIRADGPLQARDFEAPADRRSNGWWDWKPAKQALEQLYLQGDLMISERNGFQKVYDLPERVLPDWVDTSAPTLPEFADHLVTTHVRATGFATLRGCGYQRRVPGLRAALSHALGQARDEGRLAELELRRPGKRPERVYVDPAALEGRAPAARREARILSPFDNLLIQRQQAAALFDYDYQIECYVPAPRRQFGYFCLPLLYRDRLIGRADCKAHRTAGTLEIRNLFVEHPQWLESDPGPACRALARALAGLAGHNDCRTLLLRRVTPAGLRPALATACDAVNEESA